MLKAWNLISLISLSALLGACDIINPAEPIPSYISIDKIDFFDSANNRKGALNEQIITDAWVYVDNKFIGGFELPAKFPVLDEGNATIRVESGIVQNGIKATRSIFPFFKTQVFERNLVPGETVNLSASTDYLDNLNFRFREDFEDPSVKIDSVKGSAAGLRRTDDPAHVFPDGGSFSGYITLTGDQFYAEIANIEEFKLPIGGQPAYLEINYKTTSEFFVGLYINTQTDFLQFTKVGLSPKAEWNKIYIDFTEEASTQTSDTRFQVFFVFPRKEGDPPLTTYLDNIRMVTF